MDLQPSYILDNKGNKKNITKIKIKMKTSVREDLVRYFQSK